MKYNLKKLINKIENRLITAKNRLKAVRREGGQGLGTKGERIKQEKKIYNPLDTDNSVVITRRKKGGG